MTNPGQLNASIDRTADGGSSIRTFALACLDETFNVQVVFVLQEIVVDMVTLPRRNTYPWDAVWVETSGISVFNYRRGWTSNLISLGLHDHLLGATEVFFVLVSKA